MNGVPAWERGLLQALALHELAVAGNELVGSVDRIEAARLQVVAAIDRALASGVPEAEVDRALAYGSTGGPQRPPAAP